MKSLIRLVFNLVIALLLLSCLNSFAAEEVDPGKETVYVMVEPYLITNFVKKNGRLGFLNTLPRIITTKANEALVDDNMPLIKDFLVEYLGSLPEEKLRDIKQRSVIQKEAMQGIQKLFKEEVGKPVITGLIFKKFLMM